MRKDNTTLYLVLGAAALGYLAYKKGLFTTLTNAPAGTLTVPGQTSGGLQSAQTVAVEQPSFADVGGIIAPKQIDITGMSLDLY